MYALSYNNGVSIKEQPIPVMKQGESLIKVIMTCLCRTDSWIANGKIEVENNRILGHEFSGIIEESNMFKKGQTVAVFPFISCDNCSTCKSNKKLCPHKKQLGWHLDGSFSEYISVPDSQIYPVDIKDDYDAQLYAYAEPVSASLGVVEHIKKDQDIFIWGNNRIAELTRRCLQFYGFNVEVGFSMDDNKYDVVIETVNDYENIMKSLKPGGTIIIKSRRLINDNFSSFQAVNKLINFKSVGHADFTQTLRILKQMDFDGLWGKIYSKEEGLLFLESDKTEQKKSFLKIME